MAGQLCLISTLSIEVGEHGAGVVSVGGGDVELRGTEDVETGELLDVLARGHEGDAGGPQQRLGERQTTALRRAVDADRIGER